MHTINYFNTFIEIAEDSPTAEGIIPADNLDKKTIARYQFEILFNQPYKFDSDDVLFTIYAERNELTEDQFQEERLKYFSKGQPCFRSSPLTKRFGWGVHSNNEGKIAIYPAESEKYKNYLMDQTIKKVKAMWSKRK